MTAITAESVAELLEDAITLWEGVASQAPADDRAWVTETLETAEGCVERADWTGAWMWASGVIGHLREGLCPPDGPTYDWTTF